MPNKNKYGTQIVVDLTPISLRCYESTDECPAIAVLRNSMPSVKIEEQDDGTIIAKCPIGEYQEAQNMVNITCFGCRHK